MVARCSWHSYDGERASLMFPASPDAYVQVVPMYAFADLSLYQKVLSILETTYML